MLSNCDDIIRQHKAACLRVTSLLACKDIIWIGTSAGVILTISAASCKARSSTSTFNNALDQPIVTGNLSSDQLHFRRQNNLILLHSFFDRSGIQYGHTGHVRFLTCVDYVGKTVNSGDTDNSKKSKTGSTSKNQATTSKSCGESQNDLLIISGGDGFEDFRNSGANPLSDVAGREDSTNHLLLWTV